MDILCEQKRLFQSSYKAPLFLTNSHLQTLLPHFFRRDPLVHYQRERICTPDDDFLDLDWAKGGKNSTKLAILSHGLEGSSQAKYVKGMAKVLLAQGWDALAWNQRSCSGDLNKQEIFYHSGASYDLDCVVKHALEKDGYTSIALIGFSLGGNITLKYLGEKGGQIAPAIKRAIAISVPIDLKSCQSRLDSLQNSHYRFNFLKTLKNKVLLKKQRGDLKNIEVKVLNQIRSLYHYDDYVTAPLHGFQDAENYYKLASSKSYLPACTLPTLLINARNDPFLGKECYFEQSPNRKLISLFPKAGGHLGFMSFGEGGILWTEKKASEFLLGL